MDVYENLSSSKLDDDVKISVVLREAPQKLRDHLLVNSESDYNRLKAIIQAYLNTNKTWIANDLRESDPMEVNHISKGKSKGKRQKAMARATAKAKAKDKAETEAKARARAKARAKVKAAENLTTIESATCAAKEVTSHETVRHEPTMTRWWMRSSTPRPENNLCSRLNTWSVT